MTLPAFDLHRPRTIEEALALCARYGDDAALYCGGTELLLLMKLGFADYSHLIDIKAIDELHGITIHDGEICIGAATTHRDIERSNEIRDSLPALATMERSVANIRVRNAGTLGGNLCFADPHSDPATFLLALNAELECVNGNDTRIVPLRDFQLGPFQTVLAQGEILRSIRIPALPPGAVTIHRKFSFHERPAATVTCVVQVVDGTVVEARVAVGSVGVAPIRASAAEAVLTGQSRHSLDTRILAEAGDLAAEQSQPIADSNGSPEYKHALVHVLVQRCFEAAVSAAAS